ncbi:MAG TPA: hypothetical protein VIK92_00085 [Thermaerobacter sp.]
MAVQWIKKSKSSSNGRTSKLAVTILPNAVSLSAGLRQELMSGDGNGKSLYVLFGFQGNKLALVKADPSNADAWRINPKTGRTHNKKLLSILAEKGFREGRYVMEWNKRAGCYMSVATEAVTPRRRRTEKTPA